MSKQAYEARHVRGTILAMLKSYYPNGLGGRNIFNHIIRPMFPAMGWNEAFTNLTYLKERGYIEYVKGCEIREPESSKDLVYRLTASGVDVATGIVEDPAIIVEA